MDPKRRTKKYIKKWNCFRIFTNDNTRFSDFPAEGSWCEACCFFVFHSWRWGIVGKILNLLDAWNSCGGETALVSLLGGSPPCDELSEDLYIGVVARLPCLLVMIKVIHRMEYQLLASTTWTVRRAGHTLSHDAADSNPMHGCPISLWKNPAYRMKLQICSFYPFKTDGETYRHICDVFAAPTGCCDVVLTG